jgi:hypothetical protein
VSVGLMIRQYSGVPVIPRSFWHGCGTG